jgi:hypothetical protein
MLKPDLVLAVALGFEQKGLNHPEGSEPKFNPETVWRIPTDINVVPLLPPTRKIRGEDIAILNNARRAGNRGLANRKGTPPPAASVANPESVQSPVFEEGVSTQNV